LIVFFPDMDPYSPENTTYLEGSRPAWKWFLSVLVWFKSWVRPRWVLSNGT